MEEQTNLEEELHDTTLVAVAATSVRRIARFLSQYSSTDVTNTVIVFIMMT
ncbi:MAG: hypothetical protein ACI4GB_05480 [Acutalibacteraceae bacterium]